MQKGVKELLLKVAEKYKVDFEIVERIFMSQFLGAKECLSKNDLLDETTYQNVRLKYLGTLRYDPKYTKRLCETRKQKQLDLLEKNSSNLTMETSPED